MKKKQPIFDRDWNGNRKVVNKYIDGFSPSMLDSAIATEKLDGTNLRLTVRNHNIVRVEKRCNPSKLQKAKGIEEPWYIDASPYESTDKWIMDAVANADVSAVPDGEWSGEAVGPDIQGNSLNLISNRVVLFSLGQAPIFHDVPTDYNGLRAWLPCQQSKYGSACGIEGIVWHCPDGSMYKIKTKDF